MHIFTANQYEGEMLDCQEGTLHWIRKSEVLSKPTWEGDRIFLEKLMRDVPFFSVKLCYEGEKLVRVTEY